MPLDAFLPNALATVTVAAGAAPVAVALPPGANFEVQNAGAGVVYFEIGPVGTIADPATATPVLPGGARQFRRHAHGRSTTISLVAPAGGGNVYVTGGAGTPGARRRGYARVGAAAPSGPTPIFAASLTHSLVPEIAGGSATASFTRSTTGYVTDFEGVLRQAKVAEARFQGARRVQNMGFGGGSGSATTNSGDIRTWTKDGAPTVTFGALGPTGQADANTFTANAVNDAAYAFINQSGLWVSSLWLRRRTGVGRVDILIPNATHLNITAQLTGAWQRFGTGPTAISGNVFVGFSLSVAGDAIDVAYGQIEDVTGQSNQAPGEYVSVGGAAPYHGCGVDGVQYFGTTNGNSVAANIVTESAGAAIPAATLLGYYAEAGSQNMIQNSQALDNASWTPLSATITPNVIAAPDGTLTADLYTDGLNNALHLVYSNTISALPQGPYSFSVYVKPGTMTWIRLGPGQTSTVWANFNLQTGTVGQVSPSLGSVGKIVALPNGWYRCSVSANFDGGEPTSANRIFGMASDDATNGVPPTYMGTGQTMYLWGGQFEKMGAPSSYIPTASVAVTRTPDLLSYVAAGNVNGPEGTFYVEARTTQTPTTTPNLTLCFANTGNGSTDPLDVAVNFALTMYDVTGRSLGLSIPNLINSAQKMATKWSMAAGRANGACAGILGSTGAVWTVPMNVSSSLLLGSSDNTVVYSAWGTLRNVKIYNVAFADADLQALTA